MQVVESVDYSSDILSRFYVVFESYGGKTREKYQERL
jgi:hypothetical protein